LCGDFEEILKRFWRLKKLNLPLLLLSFSSLPTPKNKQNGRV